MNERADHMQIKMKAVEERIAKQKAADDDRIRPLYVLIERTGEEIGTFNGILNAIDARLDQELKSQKEQISDEIEWLMQDRAKAKQRLNAQIATACQLLKKEFDDDKAWARELANRRWDHTINEVAAVIDNLEAPSTPT